MSEEIKEFNGRKYKSIVNTKKTVREVCQYPKDALQDNKIICDLCDGMGTVEDVERSVWTTCPKCNGTKTVRTCRICKKEIPSNHVQCLDKSCRRQEEIERYKKFVEGATKIELDSPQAKDCKMLYSDFYMNSGEGYFDEIEEFFENFHEAELEEGPDIYMPEYIFATVTTTLSFDASDVVSNATDDMAESVYDGISGEALVELQNYLDEWCGRNTAHLYSCCVDYSVAIRIPWEDYDKENVNG